MTALLELFDARKVAGVVSDAAEPQGLDVNQEVFFMDPEAAAKRAAQTGGRRKTRRLRRKAQQKGGKRKADRNTFKLNLRAQIRLRSRSQRRH